MNCLLCGSDYLLTVTTELRNGLGEILRCGDCELEMLNGAPVDYTKDYRATHGPVLGQRSTPEEIFAAYRPHQGLRLELLKPHLTDKMRLLELGCSAGQFLDAVKPLVRSAAGIELDPAAAQYAREHTECSVYEKVSEIPKGEINLLCAFQVIEHLTDPLKELAPFIERLAPDGVLCVEVPSLHDPLLTIYKNEAYKRFYYHEAHRWYFSPKSLNALCEKLGFKGDIYGIQDYTFLNHLHWAFAGTPQPTSADGLDAKWPATLPQMQEVLDAFALEVDRRYKTLLAQVGQTENITFIGKRA